MNIEKEDIGLIIGILATIYLILKYGWDSMERTVLTMISIGFFWAYLMKKIKPKEEEP